MTDEVPDLLQPELGVDEPLDERVAQGVRPEPRRLHPGQQQVTPGAGGDGGMPDGPNGRRRPEEHMAVARPRSAVPQIVDDRLADDLRQREGRRVAGLPLRHREPLPFPIDVVQGQGGHLTAPQAVRHE
jgi:hypothetical protein